MISIECKKDEKFIYITTKGHAGYAEVGKDIVCASVSALIHCIAGCACMYDDSITIIGTGTSRIEMRNNRHSRVIFDAVTTTLKEIAYEYPQNVKIRNV